MVESESASSWWNSDVSPDPYAKLVEQGRGVPAERGYPWKKPQVMTYNGAEAGRELGLSRERVRQLRERFNLPRRLTEEQLEILRNRKVGI